MDKFYRYMAILVTWDQLKKYGQINFFFQQLLNP